mmetsp:Transcript_46130/g.86055  ORF Transcript_46130/g.86055 Transcript_46130/m.86055 type:complete len:249 (-) Transcript_46130:261-1007(-)
MHLTDLNLVRFRDLHLHSNTTQMLTEEVLGAGVEHLVLERRAVGCPHDKHDFVEDAAVVVRVLVVVHCEPAVALGERVHERVVRRVGLAGFIQHHHARRLVHLEDDVAVRALGLEAGEGGDALLRNQHPAHGPPEGERRRRRGGRAPGRGLRLGHRGGGGHRLGWGRGRGGRRRRRRDGDGGLCLDACWRSDLECRHLQVCWDGRWSRGGGVCNRCRLGKVDNGCAHVQMVKRGGEGFLHEICVCCRQ